MPPPQFRNTLVLLALLSCPLASSAMSDDIFMRNGANGSVELSNIPDEASFSLFMAAPGKTPHDAGLTRLASTPASPRKTRAARYRDMVAMAASRSDVDVELLHAVITVESGYNAEVVSRKGAIGLMQLMPETARRYCTCDGRDPLQNLLAGASYLHDLLKLFNNDVSLALAAYNAGENAVLRHGNRIPPYRETVAYVPKVLAVFHRREALTM